MIVPLAALAWLWLDGRTRALERAALSHLRAFRTPRRARRDPRWTERRCGF